ncbi:MAG: Co2+/Mg2+ efflux protein ApaG [Bacteroidota bacterium]|nr:Co2+/Mg2+ efflux protein ApaG [Bacteroidota bacterium]
MTFSIADHINIQVKTSFNDAQSNIDKHEYFFTYHILIKNESQDVVQLISREWLIKDSNGEKRFVEGEGVVGEQPILLPNQTFEYYSGCLLKTGFGKMKGAYIFERINNGERFDVKIPEFHFVLPWVLN